MKYRCPRKFKKALQKGGYDVAVSPFTGSIYARYRRSADRAWQEVSIPRRRS